MAAIIQACCHVVIIVIYMCMSLCGSGLIQKNDCSVFGKDGYACGRTPAKPKTTPAPPTVETTTIVLSHRKPCTEEETNTKGCLHGGECFAVFLGENRTLSCSCTETYIGQRCEEISPDIFGQLQEQEKVVTASIAAGVSVLVILLTMGVIYAVIKVKRKRNRQETRLNGIRKNGTLLTRFDSPDEADDSITEDEKKQKPLINNHLLNDIQNCNRETKV